MARRCLSSTLSNSSTCLRASKLKPSIFVCALSSARDTMRFSIGSSCGIPKRPMSPLIESGAKMRIRLSSSDTKNCVSPGSPWRPLRPRSWLSMRRASCRSVPTTKSPPRLLTSSYCAGVATPPPPLLSPPAPLLPGPGHYLALALVVFGVEHLVRDALAAQVVGEELVLFDRHGADEDRLALLVELFYLARQRLKLALLGLEDKVVVVLAHHSAVGRHLDDLQPVHFVKLLTAGLGRAGHASQLVVQAEVVLVGDARKGPALLLDRHALLGLDGLVEPLAPTAARLQPAGKLVDNDHLAVFDHILLVFVEERLGAHGGLQVVHILDATLSIYIGDAERLFRLGDAIVGQLYRLALFVPRIIFFRLEARGDAGHHAVQVVGLRRRGGNNQLRARLVDEDGVYFVDDGKVMPALAELPLAVADVVAQVVKPELRVGAVGDVRLVRLAARARTQKFVKYFKAPLFVALFVGLFVARVVAVRRVLVDDAHRHPEPRVHLPHPRRVARSED